MLTPPRNPDSLADPNSPGNGPAPGPRKSRLRGLVWAVFLLIIAAVAAYAVYRAGHPVSTAQSPGAGGGGRGGRGGGLGAVPVVVTTVTRTSMPVILNGLGNVVPYYSVTVKSRVDGQLQRLHFNEGDFVQEGQLLIEIDPRPYEVQRSLYEATLARDQAILANAKVDLARYQQLVKTDAIPSQQLDTQVAYVAQYEAIVKQDQANIDNQNLNLTYCKITAPITGMLGLRLVDPGNIVHAADVGGMVTISQLQPISVVFTIPEDNVPQVVQKLRAGEHLPVEAYNRDNTKKLASGTVMTIDSVIDATTGTSKLKAVFENKDNALFPQQFVNMNVLVDTLTNQLVVPNVAIQNGQQGAFVYVVDDQSKVHLRTVQTGVNNATSTDILNGLSEGDRVVIDGTDRLVEGGSVRVRKPGEMENTPATGPGGGRGGRGGRAGRGGDSGKGGNPPQAEGRSAGAPESDAASGEENNVRGRPARGIPVPPREGRGGAERGQGNSGKGQGGFRKGPGGGGGR